MNLLADLIDPGFFESHGDEQSLTMLLIRFLVNFLITGGIIRFLYYPRSRRRDYFFTFLLTSTTIFMLLFLLDSVQIQVGFALGLFAIFGILRYRTDTLPIREMTYLFMIIGISVINALHKNANWLDLAVINLIFIAVTWIMESTNILRHVSSKKIIYEKIDLIRPENQAALMADLKNRTGLNITKVEVGTIDFLKDTALLNVYYDSREANMADTIDREEFRSDNDD
ncbi:MAG TPA: DUF4956 domain-containing protein [Prolixibacteraceae bacterium]|nr:DUF4956 domain-containing protein [Prolixibacteraceae bacterium]